MSSPDDPKQPDQPDEPTSMSTPPDAEQQPPTYPPTGSPYQAPPNKSRKKLFFIIGGVVAVLLVVIVVIGVVAATSTITDITDAKAGDCITVSGTSTDATPKAIDCASDTFNFLVAEHLDGDGMCANEQYSQLTQKDKGKLCLVPNLRVDKCYQLAGPGGSITDFTEAECGTEPAAGGAQVVTVKNRVDSTEIDCTDGIPVTFEKPAPLGYCLAVNNSAG